MLKSAELLACQSTKTVSLIRKKSAAADAGGFLANGGPSRGGLWSHVPLLRKTLRSIAYQFQIWSKSGCLTDTAAKSRFSAETYLQNEKVLQRFGMGKEIIRQEGEGNAVVGARVLSLGGPLKKG